MGVWTIHGARPLPALASRRRVPAARGLAVADPSGGIALTLFSIG